MYKKLITLFVFLTTIFSPISGVVVSFAQNSSSTPPTGTPVQTIKAIPEGYKGIKQADFEKGPAALSSSELQKLINSSSTQSGTSVTISNIGGNSVTEIGIEDLVLDSKDYRSGATVTGTVTIKSRSNTDQTDVYLDTSLVGDYGTEQGRVGIPSIIYDTKASGPFNVKANSTTKIPVSYVMPKKVGGKGLGIEVSARTIAGLSYGWKDFHLSEVKGGGDLLNLQTAYIDVDGEEHYIQSGPMIWATSSVSFHLIVNNPSNKEIVTTPSIQIRNRTSAGELIKEYKLDPVTVAAKSDKEIVVGPYKNNGKAGVYLAVVNLLDSSNEQILPVVEYRYIMPGAVATIQDVQLDKRSVSKDDTVTANVVFSGSPFDINTGAKTTINNATINVKVLNAETDEIIGEGSASPDMNVQISEVNIPVQVKGDAQSIKTIATVTSDGKILASYKTSATTPDQTSSKVPHTKDMVAITTQLVLWLMLAGVVLITIFYFASSRGFGNGYFIAILILVSAIIGGFSYVKYADSATKVYGNYTMCTYGVGCAAFHATSYVEQTQPARVHITKGESIPVQGIVRSANCSNSGEDLKIWVYIQDTSGTVRSAVQYYRWYYDNCSAYWRATGQHQPGCGGANNASAFSFSIPTTGLPTGDYSVVVHTYDIWGNNHYWESGADEYYTTAVHVYNPVTNTCVADKTTVNVGDAVTWTATAAGGSGQYTYVWLDPENFSAVSPQSSTLTKTYSSIGTKYVSVRVYDKAITGIVSTPTPLQSVVADSQGVNAVCSTNVSLTCTAPQVLNGAGTACVTPLTCTAPQVLNPAGTACVTPLTCTSPQVLNGAGTACVCANGSTRTDCSLPVTVIPAPTITGPTDPAPEPIIARIPGKIIITFDKPLDPASVPPASSFTVTIGDPVTNPTTVPVIAVEIVGPVLTLTTGTPVTGVTALSFTYVPPSSDSPLQGLTGSDVSTFNLNFKDTDIININHTNTPPVTIVSFGMRPNIVNKNSPCSMYLKVDNAHSCKLSGTDVNPSGANHDSLNVTLYNEGNASTTLNTGPIQETTRFTLTCNGRVKDDDGNYGPTVTKTATCSLNPSRTER